MGEVVVDLKDGKRRQVLETFETLRGDSAAVFFSAHFSEKRAERLPLITDQQIRRVLREGEVLKVGPGKYRHWKVEISRRTAGDIVTVVCSVRDDRLVLITCWEGQRDGSLD